MERTHYVVYICLAICLIMSVTTCVHSESNQSKLIADFEKSGFSMGSHFDPASSGLRLKEEGVRKIEGSYDRYDIERSFKSFGGSLAINSDGLLVDVAFVYSSDDPRGLDELVLVSHTGSRVLHMSAQDFLNAYGTPSDILTREESGVDTLWHYYYSYKDGDTALVVVQIYLEPVSPSGERVLAIGAYLADNLYTAFLRSSKPVYRWPNTE